MDGIADQRESLLYMYIDILARLPYSFYGHTIRKIATYARRRITQPLTSLAHEELHSTSQAHGDLHLTSQAQKELHLTSRA